jgi:hypothetical protein
MAAGCLGVAVRLVEAHVRGKRRERVADETTFVRVALGNEEHALARRVRPLEGVLAAVGMRRRDNRIGGPAELLGVRLVATDEDHQRRVGQVLGVAILWCSQPESMWS